MNVDNQLLFGNHINQLRTIVSRAVGIMTKIRQFVSLRILKQIYFAFIHSHLTYGIIVWGATYPSYLTPLKSLQNRAIKLLSGATRFQSAHLLYKDHNILNLNSLLRQETAEFMYKFIHKQLPVQFDNYFNSVLATNKRRRKISFIFLGSAQTDYKDPSKPTSLTSFVVDSWEIITTSNHNDFWEIIAEGCR